MKTVFEVGGIYQDKRVGADKYEVLGIQNHEIFLRRLSDGTILQRQMYWDIQVMEFKVVLEPFADLYAHDLIQQ